MSKSNERKSRTPRTNAHGIDLYYEDALGNKHETSETTVSAILRAMRSDESDRKSGSTSDPIILRRGEVHRLDSPGVIEFESGSTSPVSGSIPPDIPLGYHRLRTEASESVVDLIVSP